MDETNEAVEMSEEVVAVEEGEAQVPDALESLIAEVNGRFTDPGERKDIADWLNRVSEMAQSATAQLYASRCMELPADADDVPCAPGDLLRYPDSDDEFEVIAVDGMNVYYDLGGGSFPTSIAISGQLVHSQHVMTPRECLEWFEHNIGMVDTEERREEVYARTLDMLADAMGGGE